MYLLKTRKIRAEGVPGVSDNGSLRLEAGAAQTVGRRQEQQDCFLFRAFPESSSFLAAVADGMGGLSCGSAVAKLALEVVADELEQKLTGSLKPEQLSELLVQTAETAGKKLVRWCVEEKVTAGTTLAAALIYHDKLFFCAVGDSRIYLCREGEVFQINEDHSLENYLLRCELKGEEVPELSGSLYSYLGQEAIAEIEFSRKGVPLLPGDTVLLCTDGFYQAVPEEEIPMALSERNVQKQTENLLKQVLKKKIEHQDNATLLMVHCQKNKED